MVYIREGEDAYVTTTVYDRETGLPVRQQTRLNKMLHSPPDGAPSEIVFDDLGRAKSLTWHAFNLEHREGAPASILLYDGTDLPCVESFMTEGQPREPALGPYRVVREQDGSVAEVKYAAEHERILESTILAQRNRLEP